MGIVGIYRHLAVMHPNPGPFQGYQDLKMTALWKEFGVNNNHERGHFLGEYKVIEITGT